MKSFSAENSADPWNALDVCLVSGAVMNYDS